MNTDAAVAIPPRIESVIDDWRSTFGLCEFEVLAKSILAFLKSDAPSNHHLLKLDGYDKGEGWTKRFTIDDVTDNPSVFAAMACSGYFAPGWFPKWCFTVTAEFIQRCPLETYESRNHRQQPSTARSAPQQPQTSPPPHDPHQPH